jgi:tetratricopeptide (TPR) repeat protein
MRPAKTYFAGIVIAAILCGCTATWQGLRTAVSAPSERYREKAQQYENRDELQQALFTWRVVAHLEKENSDAGQQIQRVQLAIAKAARHHFQLGLKHYRSGEYPKARREFLITLRYQPDHHQAYYYLKTRLQNPEQATYRVQRGDSYIRIATKIYKDPSKAYIIAYFNGLDPRKPLLIGKTLLLPSLDPSYLQPRSNIKALLDQARKAYQQKRYDQVVTLTRKIQKEIPGHSKAARLADAAHFDKGMQLLKRKRYLAAIEQFKQVSRDYKGRNQAIAKARNHIKQLEVEEKLVEAQQHLRSNAWNSVISVTEKILDQDPNHAQAKMLFSNASYNLGKQMLDRGDVAKAVALLERIDPSYEDTGQLISVARARMKSQAESLYRDGVKHFINEDLEMAIKEWKRALKLNPEHPKARQDIENAERLLDKLRTLEKGDGDKP